MKDRELIRVENLIRELPGQSPDRCPTCKSDLSDIEYGVIPTGQFKYGGTQWKCDCERQAELLRHYLAAGIPYKYMRYDIGDWQGDEAAFVHVNDYLEKWESRREDGMGLGFHAKELGVGKTFLATYIGRELIKRGESVLFSNFDDVLEVYQRDDSIEQEDLLKAVTVLVLDEVKEPRTDPQKSFFAARFESLIRHRTNFNKVTFYTTNMETDVLERLFPRAFSLLSSNSEEIAVNGIDRRRKLRDENKALRENGEVRPIC